jgi:HAD superfamily hydrolase (TIGR01509 family)
MRGDLAGPIRELIRERDCFLFDLDGTLVDSSPLHDRAYREALAALAPEVLRRFDYEPCKGRRTRDALKTFGIEDEALLAQLTEAKQAAYRRLVESGAVQLLPCARELLAGLRARGGRLFLVTGGSSRSTHAVLTALGIFDWFEQVVTADDVANGKPAPDCWRECVARGAIEAERALVIEDALSGIESARAAGLACIAVNNPALVALPEYGGSLADVFEAALDSGGRKSETECQWS